MTERYAGLTGQVARFSAVGIANTAIGGGSMLALQGFGVDPYLANFLGYCVGMVFSFVTNGRWTFSSTLDRSRIIRFIMVLVACYGLNLITLAIAIRFLGMNEMVSQIPAMICYTVSNFVGQRLFVFGR